MQATFQLRESSRCQYILTQLAYFRFQSFQGHLIVCQLFSSSASEDCIHKTSFLFKEQETFNVLKDSWSQLIDCEYSRLQQILIDKPCEMITQATFQLRESSRCQYILTHLAYFRFWSFQGHLIVCQLFSSGASEHGIHKKVSWKQWTFNVSEGFMESTY